MCDIEKLRLHFRKCSKQEKFVGIVLNGETIWLCEKCWHKVCDSDFEWGKDKMRTFKQMMARRRKEIREATPTEYISHKKSITKKRRRKWR